MDIGIDSLAFYTPRYVLDLAVLANKRNVDINKYTKGIGQEKMSVCPPCEDIVTMGASAALHAIHDIDKNTLTAILFATETSIDESKSAAIFVHELLELPQTCLTVELKQACSSGAAALKMAIAIVNMEPDKKVLIITSDIASYSLNSPAEPTQGAGSCAFVVSSNPRILSIDSWWGQHTSNVNDFWRPQYSYYPFVNGKKSVYYYMSSLKKCWLAYHEQSILSLSDLTALCLHLPFTKISEKALNNMLKHQSKFNTVNPNQVKSHLYEYADLATRYNRLTGNCYTASLFQSLLSFLENIHTLSKHERIGFFSYGSGCMALFFSGCLVDNYEQCIHPEKTKKLLNNRISIDYEQYEYFHQFEVNLNIGDVEIPSYETGQFIFKSITKHHRMYLSN